MARNAHECYHCKQWVAEGEAHDCWTTTEAALTAELPEDLREAWERLRETAAEFGEQRIYASLHSIMFARKSCYCFVRPKRSYLEVCIFLPRALKAPQIRRAEPSSKTKFANLLRIVHRDEVEPPVTEWLQEAYDYAAPVSASPAVRPRPAERRAPKASTPTRRRDSSAARRRP